jgi:hypothetical protein
MASVIDLRETLTNRRAEALLGPLPIFTFQPDPADAGTCCSLRLLRADSENWLGLSRDHGNFAERVRMGMRPRFVVHHDGETPVVCGEAEVKVLCRARASELGGLSEREREAVLVLLARQAFPSEDLIVLAVRLTEVRVDDGEAPLHGAIPRT